MVPVRATTACLAAVLAWSIPAGGLAQPAGSGRQGQRAEEREVRQPPAVTIEVAIRTALENVTGKVHELDLVEREGKLVWAVEVVSAAGGHFVVYVDSTDKTVRGIEEKKSVERVAGDPKHGKVVYQRQCVSCHGPDGTGKGPFGSLLTPPAADFTSPNTRDKSDAELFLTIRDGITGTAMRPWKVWLTHQEMRDVLAYVRSLSKGTAP